MTRNHPKPRRHDCAANITTQLCDLSRVPTQSVFDGPPGLCVRLRRSGFVVALLVSIVSVQLPAQDCGTTGLTQVDFRRVAVDRFSALLGPASAGVPGNFASLDVKDAQASFAATAVSRQAFLGVLKASGGLADGLVAAVSNRAVNASFGAHLLMHFLAPGAKTVRYVQQSCKDYYRARQVAEDAYSLRAAEIESGYDAVLMRRLRARLILSIGKDSAAAHDATDPTLRDSLAIEVIRTRARVKVIDAAPTSDLLTREDMVAIAEKARATAEISARSLLQIDGVTLSWLSFEYGADTRAFRLLNRSAAVDSQVAKRSSVTHTVGVTYSVYSEGGRSRSSRFLSAGATLLSTNNLSTLSKVEITQRDAVSAPPKERYAESKFVAYEGTYVDRLWRARFNADYYQFFLSGNRTAVHIFPSIQADKLLAPTWASGVGLLVTARKEGAPTTLLNAELFFTLTDLTNAAASHLNFWSRSDVGLRFSFPITFSDR